MKIILLFTFIFYILGYSKFTFAACQAVGGVRTINGKDLEIQHDIPIGTVLATFTICSALTYKCDNNQTRYMTTGGKAYGEFAIKINNIRIFKTNIEGIGYSIGVRSMCGTTYYSGNGWKNNLNNISTCANSGTWNQITHNFEVRIYKIGPTGSGIVSKRQIGASILAYNNYNVWAGENPVFLNAFKITTLGNNSGQGGNNSGSWNNGGQGGSNNGSWNNGGQGGGNSDSWNNGGQGGDNNGSWNNGGQGGGNSGSWNNGGQGGGNSGSWNNGGQGGNSGGGNWNNGGQGGNSGGGNWNNGGQGGGSGGGNWNNGGQGGNNSNNNSNNEQENKNPPNNNNNNRIWPNNNNNNTWPNNG
ncbi:hypothetical protein QE177_14825 (plasmid) [Arsenophonus sp. aPb]|uniref:hypothetical protein n=1 Tax=Arsenophonus sp. aPb TaxID=3041619 RepID=UPI002469C05F|nr:hypothetical protein [Arsenophonus sp. aPb]WGL99785.1 hypothetical protein QE177_14825 [Arsenophonus sp. aPb]